MDTLIPDDIIDEIGDFIQSVGSPDMSKEEQAIAEAAVTAAPMSTYSTVVIREKAKDARRVLDDAVKQFTQGYMAANLIGDDKHVLEQAISTAEDFHRQLLEEAAAVEDKILRARNVRDLKPIK